MACKSKHIYYFFAFKVAQNFCQLCTLLSLPKASNEELLSLLLFRVPEANNSRFSKTSHILHIPELPIGGYTYYCRYSGFMQLTTHEFLRRHTFFTFLNFCWGYRWSSKTSHILHIPELPIGGYTCNYYCCYSGFLQLTTHKM